MKIAFEMGEVELDMNSNPDRMTEKEFVEFCLQNPDLNIERESDGTTFLMSPIHFLSSRHEARLQRAVMAWNEATDLGEVFTSSAGFTLNNKAVRSPDVSWISHERINALPIEEYERFAHIAPDFVAEMRSHSDSIRRLKNKMQEYIDCGCRLAFLIDPVQRKAWVYRPGKEIYEAAFSENLSGYDVLPGFELDLNIFQ